MSLMDKFFGSGAKHASAPNTAVPGGPNTQAINPGGIPNNTGVGSSATGAADANGVIPPGAQNPAAGANTDTNKSPLSEFNKLWEPATGPDGKPVQVTKDPLFNVDPKQVMEAAQKTDFRSVATPEQLQKMAAGGQEGIAAMMDVFQAMSASVYANAAVAATKIAESGITKALSQAEGRLPSIIRQQQFGESLAQKNPALQDPAVQPMIKMLEQQFAQKYPNANSAELTDMAQRYMLGVSEAFNPAKQQALTDQQKQVEKENNNWDIFFDQQPGGGGFTF